MKAVILQPMYLPWMGYFGMIDQADTFVYYDDVQFVRRSWQRRNKIKVPNGDFTWLTVPVKKDFGQEIKDVEVKSGEGWQDEHWKSIQHSYAGTEFFDKYSDALKEIYEKEWGYLMDLNVSIIDTILDSLGTIGDDTNFMYSSNVATEGNKTERLINILTEIDADSYISGPGAKEYIDSEKFEDAGIDLFWHEFEHPEYEQQQGEFVSHLSVIDALFHTGEATVNLIRETEKDALVHDDSF